MLTDDGLEAAQTALEQSAAAVSGAAQRSRGLTPALDVLLRTEGRVVFAGLGKSGLVAAKLAATFASTGTPALTVHAADALHGDAGMVMPGDVLFAISKSGQTAEVLEFAHMVGTRDVPVVAMTGCGGRSALCRLAAAAIDASVEHEADPWDVVPTASTTVCLAMGDALAIGLMAARKQGPAELRQHHPGGILGARLASQACSTGSA